MGRDHGETGRAMAGADADPAGGRRVLIVEDEFMVALDAETKLRELGCRIAGVAGSVAEALRLVDGAAPDAAVLDVNLRGERVYPVADALAARGVPFVFATGYDAEAELRARYGDRPYLRKPYGRRDLARRLLPLLDRH